MATKSGSQTLPLFVDSEDRSLSVASALPLKPDARNNKIGDCGRRDLNPSSELGKLK
jgi:hypothetical protein